MTAHTHPGSGPDHDHRPTAGDHATNEEFWEAFYRDREQVWSGEPNAALVNETAGLTPGTALDLGCGEGGDAIWLAARGWTVTATDISQVALDRVARHAGEAGVAERVELRRHDLAVSFPAGTFDLVSAHFLHSYHDIPRERILRNAAAAVAPGGHLLIVGHLGFPPWEHNPHPEVHFPTPDEVVAALELPSGEWEVLVSREHERIHDDPEGRPATRLDCTVKIRRLPG
ncbi:SAM-dependent methyltransferase [Amycolatopsis antarctica]|uniref:SAM-dependent methyltransferase n=1 Tax=Amycolatopsis antarctica TaxID=1854586 RepID=A0A263D0M6_9PSEU|nr:class I SAM-dependent methyltransferase [Amycolatopsis antarctica]OZM71990.1 SAM-dependent methyltransferase [Amycolatopsis antarctica]